ncbi:MAG: hypothetical protein V1676_06975 [Candidatus Diapherotrites archaeon]
MAKPIIMTPELKGKDAERFLDLHTGKGMTEKDVRILQSCIATYESHER